MRRAPATLATCGLLLQVFIFSSVLAQNRLAVLFQYDGAGLRILKILRTDAKEEAFEKQLVQLKGNSKQRSKQHLMSGAGDNTSRLSEAAYALRWYDSNGSVLQERVLSDPRLIRLPDHVDHLDAGLNLRRESGVFLVHGPLGADSLEVVWFEHVAPVIVPGLVANRRKSLASGHFSGSRPLSARSPVEKIPNPENPRSGELAARQIWTFSLNPD